MSQPDITESALAEFLRRTFRAYRNLPLSPGHALLRRLFRALIACHQRMGMRNGVRLVVDLDSMVQHTIFWMDGDMEPQGRRALLRTFLGCQRWACGLVIDRPQ